MPPANAKIAARKSPIHGRGLFAAVDIAPGDVIHVWAKSMQPLAPGDFEKLSPRQRKRVSVIDGQMVLFKPPACWVNHSCAPNARGAHGRDIAIRHIHAGEEITVDYIAEQVPGLDFECACAHPQCRRLLRCAPASAPGPVRPAQGTDVF